VILDYVYSFSIIDRRARQGDAFPDISVTCAVIIDQLELCSGS
jgi:hypothetical protein